MDSESGESKELDQAFSSSEKKPPVFNRERVGVEESHLTRPPEPPTSVFTPPEAPKDVFGDVEKQIGVKKQDKKADFLDRKIPTPKESIELDGRLTQALSGETTKASRITTQETSSEIQDRSVESFEINGTFDPGRLSSYNRIKAKDGYVYIDPDTSFVVGKRRGGGVIETGKYDHSRIDKYKTENVGIKTGIFVIYDPKTGEEVGEKIIAADGTEQLKPSVDFDHSRTDYKLQERIIHWTVFKDPQRGETVAWLPAIEGGAGLIPDLPLGLSVDQLRTRVRKSVMSLEANNSNITPELIMAYVNNLSSYEGIDYTDMNKLITELEARLYLAGATWRLGLQDYEGFANFYTTFDADAFNSLRDEVLGPEGIQVLRQMEAVDAAGVRGGYFRLDDATRIVMNLDDNSLIHVLSGVPMGPITPQQEAEGTARLTIIKRLFNSTGMASWYTGPMRGGQLLDEQFMENAVDITIHSPVPGPSPVDVTAVATPPLVTGVAGLGNPAVLRELPNLIYARNERYWDLKRQDREANLPTVVTVATPDPYPLDSAGRLIDDPAINMRRLLYLPEELTRLARISNTGGRAASLRYAAELYLVTLPQFNGVRSLEEFLGPQGTAEDRFTAIVKKGRAFQYAAMVRGAGAAAAEMVKLITEPVKGGENAGADLGKDLANVLGVVEKYSAYLTPIAAPNIISLATSRILESTFRWLNGNSPDRRQHFPRVPRFGQRLLNAVIKADVFQAFMDVTRREQALAGVNASEQTIQWILARQASTRWGWDVLKILLKQIVAR